MTGYYKSRFLDFHIKKLNLLFFFIISLMSLNLCAGGLSEFDFANKDVVNEKDIFLMNKAKSGDEESQYLVGRMFCCSKNVKYDPYKAAFWFGRSAGQGYSEAQFMVGYIHSMGRGVKKDKRKALLWYERAASKGHPGAMFRIGEMYLNGDGVERDADKAKKYLIMSAERGNGGAIDLLKKLGD
jgi:hypothetical protein